MKKAGVSSILITVVLLVLGVIADAQQPKKVRGSVISCKTRLAGRTEVLVKRSAKGCANSVTLTERML